MDSNSRNNAEIKIRELIKRYIGSAKPIENMSIIVWSEKETGKTYLIRRALERERIDPIHVEGPLFASHEAAFFEAIFQAFCQAESIPPSQIHMELSVGLSLFGINIEFKRRPSLANELRRKADFMARHLNDISDDSNKLVFFIENFQNVDDLSANLLSDLSNRLYCSLMILELRLSDPGALSQYRKGIADNAETSCFSVKVCSPAPSSLASIAKEATGRELSEDEARGIYEESNESLSEFISRCHSSRGCEQVAGSPSSLERMIVCLLFFHGRPVDSDELNAYIEHVDLTQYYPFTIQDALANLIAMGCLEECDGILSPRDARVVKSCLTSKWDKENALRAIIHRVKAKENKTPEDTLRLVDAQIALEDPGVSESLKALGPALGQIRYEKSFIKKAAIMTNNLVERGDEMALYVERAFLDAFLESGDHQSIKLYISQLSSDNELIALYRFALSSATKNDLSVDRQYHSLLANHAGSGRLEFLINLNLSAYYMRFAERKKACAFLDFILTGDERCKGYPEFFWALKQRTTYLSNRDALDDLKKCMLFFESHGQLSAYARTRMTYALRLALSGEPEQALAIFRADFEEQLDPTCPDCYYLNNIAACQLMMQEEISVSLEMLKSALAYPITQYGSTLIKCNLFAAHLAADDTSRIDEQARELLDLADSDYAATPPTHMCLTNLLAYSRHFNPEMEDGIVQKLKALSLRSDRSLAECIDSQINNTKLPPTHRYGYIRKHGFRPGFIGFWQMQIDQSITNRLIEKIRSTR